MVKAELNSDFIATAAGDITVYNYDGVTREYLSSSREFLALGVGIPANSAIDKPPVEKGGSAICRKPDNSGWEYLDDHRGETVYNTGTSEPVTITTLGKYPTGTTTLSPTTSYDSWNGNEWVTDTTAQHVAEVLAADVEKETMIEKVNAYINSKQWSGKAAMGRLKDSEKADYNTWLDYLDALEAVDTSSAPDINWPTPPEERAS